MGGGCPQTLCPSINIDISFHASGLESRISSYQASCFVSCAGGHLLVWSDYCLGQLRSPACEEMVTPAFTST